MLTAIGKGAKKWMNQLTRMGHKNRRTRGGIKKKTKNRQTYGMDDLTYNTRRWATKIKVASVMRQHKHSCQMHKNWERGTANNTYREGGGAHIYWNNYKGITHCY
jgi:hypothetical protein